ncbi:hypothetical protein D3C81_1499430 [compost metagenome]
MAVAAEDPAPLLALCLYASKSVESTLICLPTRYAGSSPFLIKSYTVNLDTFNSLAISSAVYEIGSVITYSSSVPPSFLQLDSSYRGFPFFSMKTPPWIYADRYVSYNLDIIRYNQGGNTYAQMDEAALFGGTHRPYPAPIRRMRQQFGFAQQGSFRQCRR